MSEFLQDIHEKRCKQIRSLGLKAGDFVSIGWEYPCVWHEVQDSIFLSSPNSSFLSVYTRDGKTSLELLATINRIHRQDDPWNHGEARYVFAKDGEFGTQKGLALPDRFHYQGTYALKVWGWKYRNGKYLIQNSPKCPDDMEPWLLAVGTTGKGIPWNQVGDVIARLKVKTIGGWRLLCETEAETTPSHTIKVRNTP